MDIGNEQLKRHKYNERLVSAVDGRVISYDYMIFMIGGKCMIQVKHVEKSFKVARRVGGLKEASRALFRREYECIQALDDISFTIKKGEIVGYVGPNGAGKSSTIKMLSGILTPDKGSCIVNGFVPWLERKKYVKSIGVVFGQRSQLWWDVPIMDSFELLKDIYQVPDDIYQESLAELTAALDLTSLLATPARQLSLGQRMRCEIAASLLHRPTVLFLDEPTIGLDAVSKLAIRKFILTINKKYDTTIILTTHDTSDIVALCERVLLIGKGKILMDGSFEDIKRKVPEAENLDEMIAQLYHQYHI